MRASFHFIPQHLIKSIAGMQVLAGDVLQGIFTFEAFMSVWVKFGVLPERYYYSDSQLHSSEIYYPLRPELIESNFYLYQASALLHLYNVRVFSIIGQY